MISENISLNYSLDKGGFFPLIKQPVYMIVIYTIAYSVVFVSALIGNIMVIVVVIKKKSMHSITNYFLVNLAVANIFMALFCVPVNLIVNLYNGWQLGSFMCKVTPYLQGVAVCASVNTLAAIALDRYFAICHALEMKIDLKKSRIMLVTIWVVAFGIMVPWLIFYNEILYSTPVQKLYICFELWPNFLIKQIYYMGVIFICCYSLPLIMIVVCYILIGLKVWRRGNLGEHTRSDDIIQRSKVKVIKMLVVVCVLFAFSWMPMYGLKFWKMVQPNMEDEKDSVFAEIVFPVSQWLGSSNCCVNPLIYCFFSKKFRKGFRDLVMCCDWKVKYVSGSPETRMATMRYNSRSSSNECRL